MAVEARHLHLPRRTSSIPMETPHPTVSFLGEEISAAIRLQQLELDRLILSHADKARRELWDIRQLHFLRIISTIERWASARIRAKEEEIAKLERENGALEERLRGLCLEGQLWRELAEANEAAAGALRADIERTVARGGGASEEDAESRCEDLGGGGRSAGARRGACRACGAAEPTVLLLPCRHLCVCAACGPAVVSCPVCACDKNGSVNVNVS